MENGSNGATLIGNFSSTISERDFSNPRAASYWNLTRARTIPHSLLMNHAVSLNPRAREFSVGGHCLQPIQTSVPVLNRLENVRSAHRLAIDEVCGGHVRLYRPATVSNR